ncbi:NAPSA isoform 5 [Pongo abelii]|uniref:NAPSA isoform 5 n=1 Tax=Pongo abelii TaxID=9601 RepID=A0A2J8U8V6_PONAB|nr:NAPSA isoform 5 [Pongo abelii]
MSPPPLLLPLLLLLLPLLNVERATLIRIPLHRVQPERRTLNLLRGWREPAELPKWGAPSLGDKPTFVPLSNYRDGYTADLIPKPPAPSRSMGPSLPFNMELGG